MQSYTNLPDEFHEKTEEYLKLFVPHDEADKTKITEALLAVFESGHTVPPDLEKNVTDLSKLLNEAAESGDKTACVDIIKKDILAKISSIKDLHFEMMPAESPSQVSQIQQETLAKEQEVQKEMDVIKLMDREGMREFSGCRHSYR